MPIRKASAIWTGNLKEGNGTISLVDGRFSQPYSFTSRFGEGTGTNPDELMGAALAGCYSMALAGNLAKAGFSPVNIETQAHVHIEKVGEGFKVTQIELHTQVRTLDMDEVKFMEIAETTKKTCPIAQALQGTEITLAAELKVAGVAMPAME